VGGEDDPPPPPPPGDGLAPAVVAVRVEVRIWGFGGIHRWRGTSGGLPMRQGGEVVVAPP
jgi:hypothetical protein